MKVGDFAIPKNKVCVCSKNTLLTDVAKCMLRYKIGCVVVVENDNAIGIITKSDLIKAAYGETPLQKLLSQVLASDVMSTKLITVDEEIPRDTAADVMSSNNVHHLIVTRRTPQGEVKFSGLTSALDVVREAALASKAFPYTRSFLRSLEKSDTAAEESFA